MKWLVGVFSFNECDLNNRRAKELEVIIRRVFGEKSLKIQISVKTSNLFYEILFILYPGI
jgi:hypothetical protein